MEKKMKTLDFSGSVAFDLKVGTYIQLIELMKFHEYFKGQVHLLKLAKGHLHIEFKT